MKKLIGLLMILAVLLSLCACGGQTNNEPSENLENPTTEATEAPTEEKVQVKTEHTPEELYGHIDQTKPNSDGVYKLWSADGVANMANDPAGTFELLCNIDMEGAALSPIGSVETPFTGKIDGKSFIISNFTLATEGEALGFVGVNEGTIQDLQLEDVTVTAADSNKYIGTMAGSNKATILRCKSSGTLTADAAAADAAIGGAIGANSGEFTNSTVTVDVLVNAAGAATVGGLVGTSKGGKVEYTDSYGAITVTGENKSVGLLAGSVDNTPFTDCAFMGADNSLNGALFTNLSACGNTSNFIDCPIRDNTPLVMTENEQALRQKVLDTMYNMISIEWRVRENLAQQNTATSTTVLNKDYTMYGMSYSSAGASLSRFRYCLDEEGYMKDFVYDWDVWLQQCYIGNNCSSSIGHAYWTVSNSVMMGGVEGMWPIAEQGCLPVGDWAWDVGVCNGDSMIYVEATGEQQLYECYALMRPADIYIYYIKGVGAHARMAAEKPVVVRNTDGTIDPNRSYIISHEQGYTTNDTQNKTYTTCRVAHKYTFANLIYDGALPVTCEELITGEMEPATCELIGGTDGKMGMVTGTVKTNYYLDYVDLVIVNESGEEVLNQRMFPGVAKSPDASYMLRRSYIDTFDLGRFIPSLAEAELINGENYSYTITATNSPGDTFVVTEGSFMQG